MGDKNIQKITSQLNSNPEISEFIPLTYSMLINNIDITKQKKVKSEYFFLNLEKLVQNFKLDSRFISKSYYQSNPEFAYNDPPLGPIEQYFECMFCNEVGPHNHLQNCIRPFESSLYLTSEGTKIYTEYEEGTPYSLVKVKRGQKKVISKSTKTDKYTDSVTINYSDVNGKECIIRISKNGSINVISAGIGNKKLPNEIINKINQTGSLNVSNYSKIYPGSTSLSIDPKITYKYLLFGQFNLYPKDLQKNVYINLGALNLNLWGNGSLFKKSISKQNVFVLPDKDLFYYITDYEVNLGDKLSKSNKLTNSFIKFNMLKSNYKINVQIYKRGSVQMKMSYIDSKDEARGELNLDTLEIAFSFLEELFTIIIVNSSKTSMPIIVNEVEIVKKGIHNMVDGKQPKVCANRSGLRPVPYSFYGECPSSDMYVRPEGKSRGDGTFEPCCYKIKGGGSQDSQERYNDILLNGYPDKLAAHFKEYIPDPDDRSAVFKPGTKSIESRRFRGLNQMNKEELLSCIEDSGYIRKKTTFDTYLSFKDSVLSSYASLIGFKRLPFQHSISMTVNTSKKLTENAYILTPINDEAINVILYFNELGESYFINLNKDVSESSLPAINDLQNSIVEGYLYPYPDEFIFYPIDILYLKGKNVMNNQFLGKLKESRYNSLMYCINTINSIGSGGLQIEINNRFDLNVVQGANNYLTNTSEFGDISGLLFIPIESSYIPKNVNKNLLLWTDTKKFSNLMLTLNVFLKSGNRWEVKIDSKSIPLNLLPQENGTIEIPVKFVNKNNVKDGDIILFEINLNVNGTINTKKPLKVIQKTDEQINDYSDIINILQSIQTPISKSVFTTNISEISGRIGFTIGDKFYYQSEARKPLGVLAV